MTDVPPIDISPANWEIVAGILRRHIPDREVWAFGSRARWTAREYSDLDLAILGDGPIGLSVAASLDEAFAESDLPFKVDLVDWATTSEAFRQVIREQNVVVQEGRGSGRAGEWRETTLGDVIELKRGYDLPQRERAPGPVPLVSSSGVTDCHSEAKVKGPGVVTGRYGTLGQVFFVREDFWPLNTTLYVRDFKGNDPRFVGYFLTGLDYLAYSDKAAVPGLNRNHLHQATVLFPSDTEEQRAIAHILGTLDDKIELNRRMSETLEQQARALFKSWFVDFDPVRAKSEGRDPGLPQPLADLFPDSFEDSELGEIPKGWGVGTLGDVTMLNPEVWSKRTRPTDISYIDLSNTKWGRIESIVEYQQADAPSRAQRVLRPGDTIVGTVRPGNGSYAFVSDAGLTGSTAFAVLRPKRPEYAQFVYLAATDRENIEALSHLSDGGAYPAVRPEVVAATPVALPLDAIVDRFAELSHPSSAKIATSERESRTLAALRDSLLPKLISGELRVRDAEKFVTRAAS
ncbi:MAG: restriction endonuclease subunit S [Gemmatimonadales bacterium]|nr:restriction endonuclease subunit S [Gemmatimonadales bacterium]